MKWVKDVEDEDGYGWLQRVFYRWREAEREDVPEYWINDDGNIDFNYYGKHMEMNGKDQDPEDIKKWLEDHSSIIDWEEFEEWCEEVWDKEGYEWLHTIVAAWEAEESGIPVEWIDEEGMIEWSYVAEYLETNKG